MDRIGFIMKKVYRFVLGSSIAVVPAIVTAFFAFIQTVPEDLVLITSLCLISGTFSIFFRKAHFYLPFLFSLPFTLTYSSYLLLVVVALGEPTPGVFGMDLVAASGLTIFSSVTISLVFGMLSSIGLAAFRRYGRRRLVSGSNALSRSG